MTFRLVSDTLFDIRASTISSRFGSVWSISVPTRTIVSVPSLTASASDPDGTIAKVEF
jgi:hypothetical protein